MEPRARAGYIEDTLVLALAGYVASIGSRALAASHPFLDADDVRAACQIGGTIAGALLAKLLRDKLGAPFIPPRPPGQNGGNGAGTGAALLVLLLALVLATSGCAAQLGTVEAPAIDADGSPVAGAPPVRCKGLTVAIGNAGVGETCAAGGELSEMGANFLGQLLSPFAWLARIASAGAGAAAG